MKVKAGLVVALLIGLVLGSFGMLVFQGGFDSRPGEASSVEEQLREVIFIPEDEELISSTLLDSEEQIVAIRAGNPDILAEAQAGDHYLVFETRAILFLSLIHI